MKTKQQGGTTHNGREQIARHYVIGGTKFQASQLEAALYLVSTPIGNLGDITLRALETLAAVDMIACEDTRVSRVLLEHYGIRKKLVSYHEHNRKIAGTTLLDALQAGKSIGLVSDAGTPLICDPGFELVRDARTAGIPVVPIPGASAMLSALVASGLPVQNFFFDGFLSAKSGQRRKRLGALKSIATTLIFYESPHRLVQTLHDMVDILGADREAALCRELTKFFEETVHGTLGSLAQKYDESTHPPRGEIVLAIAPPSMTETTLSQDGIDHLLKEAAQTMSPSQAATAISLATGHKRQELYQRLLALKDMVKPHTHE